MSQIPRREEFNPNMRPVYRLVAPAMVKIRGTSAAQAMPVGAIVDVDGLPAAWLEPMNADARYRKFHAIRKAVQSPAWYTQAVLTAVSLGAPAGSYEDAAKFTQQWMNDYPKTEGERT